MDDDESNIESFKTEIFLDKLGRTVRYAKLRCLSPTEIFDRIAGLDLDPEVTDYVYRISELRLTGSNLEHLLGAMKNLANRSESSSSKVRAKIDRILLRLVRLLPTDIGNNFAEPFVDHRLKSRRRWAYSSLRQKPISKIIAVKLANVFKQHGDQDALKLIARNPKRVTDVGGEFLLANINEEYWRARVVEALLDYDRPTALLIAKRYPFEFAHAVGRSGDDSLVSYLTDLFPANQDDMEFISIYAFALGKLGAIAELESLECFIAVRYPNSQRRQSTA
ncbi:MAG: hypothetical protein DSY78_16300 [Chloroflexi bacterium]|jgi:hypothetical protein|nr:hypothetical protein [Dehalococcoidia bacterium]RUA28336.1 MAG: hypothetical protein DSY78_16300 [Chloroflexota bacterium]